MRMHNTHERLSNVTVWFGFFISSIIVSISFGLEPENLSFWHYGEQHPLVGVEYEQALKKYSPVDFSLDMRWGVTEASHSIVFSVKNEGKQPMSVETFHNHRLSLWGDGVSESTFAGEGSRTMAGYLLDAGAKMSWRWRSDDIVYSFMGLVERSQPRLYGRLARLSWRYMGQSSEVIWIAFPDNDRSIEHVDVFKGQTNNIPIIAVVYDSDRITELSFIYFNHESASLNVESLDFLHKSSIILKLIDGTIQEQIGMDQFSSSIVAKKVSNGVCYVVRVPWNSVREKMQGELVDALMSTDGRYDLAWNIGGVVSEPLRMLLLPPTRIEQEHAFIESHGHMKRISANANVWYDIRLAAVNTSSPQLRGVLRNQETFGLLADMMFVDINRIRTAFRKGRLFSFIGATEHPRVFVVKPGTDAVFNALLNRHVCAIESYSTARLKLPERVGVVINYGWQTPVGHIGSVWVAFPDKHGAIAEIHCFDIESAADQQIGVILPITGVTSELIKINDENIMPILALAIQDRSPSELWFLLFDKTKNSLVYNDVIKNSLIILKSDKQVISKLSLEQLNVEQYQNNMGMSGVLRIPWQPFYALIPEADLAAIKAAGGDLDLVWKVGDFQSDPLPISLVESGGAQ